VIICADTNFLVYAEQAGQSDVDRRKAELSLRILASRQTEIILPLQALGEFYTVMLRKYGLTRSEASVRVDMWKSKFPVMPTSVSSFDTARDLAVAHKLSLWDAIILAVAAEAGCALLLSEDLQNGFFWRGVTVVNPYAEPLHPRLAMAVQPS
jgi:predicted nucleic acid-binding protein